MLDGYVVGKPEVSWMGESLVSVVRYDRGSSNGISNGIGDGNFEGL